MFKLKDTQSVVKIAKSTPIAQTYCLLKTRISSVCAVSYLVGRVLCTFRKLKFKATWNESINKGKKNCV